MARYGPSPWTTSPAKKLVPRSALLWLCVDVEDAIRVPSPLVLLAFE